MTASRHDEVTSRDIPNLSDRRSQTRSRSSNIVARYQSFDKETGEVRYSVTSQTKAGKAYTVTFRMKDWHPDMEHLDDELQHAVKGDIEIDCTCPAFTYQGYKFLATARGGAIDPENRPPDETNKDRHGYACKHILKAIDSFNTDFDKFRAEGKGIARRHNLRVQHKYEGKGNVRRYGLSRNEGTTSAGHDKETVMTYRSQRNFEMSSRTRPCVRRSFEGKFSKYPKKSNKLLQAVLDKCDEFYDEAYNARDKVEWFDDMLDLFDNYIVKECNPLVGALVTARGDVFSSDRDCAALAMALVYYGLWPSYYPK